jgi:hypothetical protein
MSKYNELLKVIPSQLNQEHGVNVSERYKVIKTGDLVQAFQDQGYTVSEIKVARVRKPEYKGFQKHLIRLRHPSLSLGIDGLHPEIIIKNAYNGTSSFEIMFGVYRLVCSNGLIVGKTYESARVRHVGDAMPKVIEAMSNIQRYTTQIKQDITDMMLRQLTDSEVKEFARQIAEKLLPAPKTDEQGQPTSKILTYSIDDLTAVNRSADLSQDLWTILNRIQENAIHGGLNYLSQNSVTNTVRRNTVRRINAIDRSVEINQLVWDTATQFLKAA